MSARTPARSPLSTPVFNVLALIERRQIGWFVLMLFVLLASASITLGFGYILRGLVDQGFTEANVTHLNRSLLLMLAMIALLACASFARLSISGYLAEQVVSKLRLASFSRLLSLDPAFYQRRHSSELASAVSTDTTLIGTVIATSMPLVVRNILLCAGGIAMLVATSPHLTLMVLLVLPLVALPVVVIGRHVRKNAKGAQEQTGLLGGMMGEALAAIQTVQSYTAEAGFIARFTAMTTSSLQAAMRQTFSRSAMAASIIFILFSSLCAVMWVGAHDVLDGKMSAGALTSFVFYAAIVASAFGVLGDVGAALFRAAAALERIRDILALTPTISADEEDAAPMHFKGAIAFNEVFFKYDLNTATPVLDGISFSVRAGETVAVVGPSGAGKTTLFQLLMRFYDPDMGSVKLDGQSLRGLHPKSVRGAIAYVPQDGALFSGTVRENILLGKPDATQTELDEAAKGAMAYDFIMALPEGYETRLGERGMRLSGGQKQRIALARALLKEAPVLLLDEATSALDSENEKAIQEAVHNLHGTRTVIIIAHRLSTIMEADRIFVMNAGRIIEEGRHAELMAKAGVYARMVDQQFALAETRARLTHPDLSGSLH